MVKSVLETWIIQFDSKNITQAIVLNVDLLLN